MIIHPIAPIFDENSKILILGSFPSVKSRENMFFYSHPQNRFWKVLCGILGHEEVKTIEEKRTFILEQKIALWDVIASCNISGAPIVQLRMLYRMIYRKFWIKLKSKKYLSTEKQLINTTINISEIKSTVRPFVCRQLLLLMQCGHLRDYLLIGG